MGMSMDALLKIRAQVDGANKIVELNRGLRSVEGAAKGVTGAMRGLSGASAGLSGALGALAPLASVAGLVGLAKGALDAGDKLYDMAQKTGVSVESLARFKKAAATSGTDIDAVAKSLGKLSRGMVEAATTGKGKAAEALKYLGISATDASGKIKKADQVTLEIANRFKGMADGPIKTAKAMDLFGKAGADMIPMLNMGSDAIEKLSVKMTTAFAQKADAYSDKLAMLSGKVGALGADLLIALLPALDAVTDAVTAGVGAFNALPGPVKGLAVSAAMLAIAWGPLSGLIAGASTLFIAGAAAVGTLRVQIALAAMEGIPALNAAILSIPGWGWALAGATALAALSTALYANNKEFKNWVDNIVSIVANDFKGAMDSIAKGAKDAFKAAVDAGSWFNARMRDVANSIPQGFASGFARMVQTGRQAFQRLQTDLLRFWNTIPAPIRGMLSGTGAALGNAAKMIPGVYPTMVALQALGKGAGKGKKPEPLPTLNNDLPTLTGGGGSGTGRGSGSGAADKAAADAKRLAEERAKQLLDSQKRLAISQAELTITQASNTLEKAAAEYALQKLRIEQDFAGKLADAKSIAEKSNLNAIKRNELEKIRLDYLKQQTNELLRQAGIDNPDFGKKPPAIDPKGTYGYNPSAGTGLQGEGMAKLDDAYNKIKDRLKEMADPVNQIIGAANAIGDAFANSFEGVINGTMSAKQALGSFFRDIANYFSKMATQMIADAIRMAAIKILTNILGSVLGGIGGGGGGMDLGKNFSSAGAGSTGIDWSKAVQYKPNAMGNVYGANGIVPFAAGGVFDRPTFFKFANGGTLQNGVLGEAGPEGILPLRRGADGKLGVISSGGSGTTNISINVDAKGTKAEGDQGKSGALARDLAAVVDQRLVFHKRPGGILA
jgi:lambda family phage tail tape measure protein